METPPFIKRVLDRGLELPYAYDQTISALKDLILNTDDNTRKATALHILEEYGENLN